MKLFLRWSAERLIWAVAVVVVFFAASIIVVSSAIRKLAQIAVLMLQGVLRTAPKGASRR